MQMKWGRKTPSPPSFGSPVITRVFPGSWFSKFKQTGGRSLDTTSGKKQLRGKLDFSTGNSSLPRDGRFYSLDNDAYWTLSFRKDRCEGKRRNKSGRINPLWYESDDEYLVAVSNFKGGSGSRKSQFPRRDLEAISELDTEEKREGCSDNIPKENVESEKKKPNRRSRKQRRRVGRKKKKKAELRTGLDEGEKESSNPEEEEQEVSLTKLQIIDEVEEESQDSSVSNSRNHQNTSCQKFGQSSDGEDYATSEKESTLKSQNLENTGVEEYYEEAESQEDSAYISKRSRSKKIKNPKKAHGSRTEYRIQALAEIKKARMKLKKKEKKEEEEVAESSIIYNSFAVVKGSFNPQQDFRDSMMEMIKEKGITHREELEELLACYLTLNCDEHHHLIINAFQQVWFELNRIIY